MSWAVQNSGPRNLTAPFSTHLYLDGIFINSWRGDGVDAGNYVFYDDWEGIADNIRLMPGNHVLKLWIDPYNEVQETNEDDNILQLPVVVTGTPAERTGTRLPDLALRARDGWDAPLVLNSWGTSSANGPLSVDTQTYVSFAGQNIGLSSALDGVSAQLYVDNVYIEAWLWSYVLSDDAFYLGAWPGLQATMRLDPGEHVVRLVLDAGDLVQESDETNNTLAKTFTWTTGPVAGPPVVDPPPTPVIPPPVTRPDLVPYWLFESDGPIVVSRTMDTRADDPVLVGTTAYVDLTVHNQSRFETGPFSVAMYLDGNLLRTFYSTSLLGSGVREFLDQSVQLDVAPGQHTVRMVIDPDNRVAEHSESNNTYDYAFTVYQATPPPPTPIIYTTKQIDSILSRLSDALDDRRPVLGEGSSGLDSYAREVADIGYYLMTGRSVQDEDLRILLLSDADYRQWIDNNYADDFATSLPVYYEDLVARREHLKAVNPAFKTRDKGQVTVVVNAEHSFADVLSSLAHELGHARQDFERPGQTVGGSSFELNAIQEAEAQQFERAFWLMVQPHVDRPILSYPADAAYDAYVESVFEGRLADYQGEEHSMGYLLQWLAVLADPDLTELKVELASNHALSASGSLALFTHLIAIKSSEATAYVNDLIEGLDDWLPTILEIARARTVEGLPAHQEGPPDLRSVALASP